jgi:AcrR family transcriptional regulator
VSTSRERGHATRAKILQATAELIAEAGWSGFSTRDIAARADVTQGIVSYHWRSKEELVREAALTASADALAPVYAVFAEAPGVAAALEQLLALENAIRDQPRLALLLLETMLHAGRDQQLRDALAAMLRDFRAQLAAALGREHTRDPTPTAAALTAALDGLFLHAVVDDQLDLLAAGATLHRLVETEAEPGPE